MMKIESTINETESQVYEIVEKQKEMLSDVTQLDHIEFAKIELDKKNKEAQIEVLLEVYKKLFNVDYKTIGNLSAWEFYESNK